MVIAQRWGDLSVFPSWGRKKDGPFPGLHKHVVCSNSGKGRSVCCGQPQVYGEGRAPGVPRGPPALPSTAENKTTLSTEGPDIVLCSQDRFREFRRTETTFLSSSRFSITTVTLVGFGRRAGRGVLCCCDGGDVHHCSWTAGAGAPWVSHRGENVESFSAEVCVASRPGQDCAMRMPGC